MIEERTRMAQRYAEVLVSCQERYGRLLAALDDDNIGLERFEYMAHRLAEKTVELKALRLTLNARKSKQQYGESHR